MAEQDYQPQNIVEWVDEDGRRHFAGEGTFAHRQHEINEKSAVEEKAPEELTSTPGGKPAGPPKDPAPKPA